MADQLKYVNAYHIALKDEDNDTLTYLIWGDPVHVKDTNPTDSELVEVRARGYEQGFLPRSALMDEPLLEIYVIDVGQGDGVLFKTPDGRWHMIDAGVTNAKQMTGKGAANFVRWKFLEDLRRERVELENLILSHPDFDHYGGMIDLLGGTLGGHEPFDISVKHFYHSGMGRFQDKPKLGAREAGEIDDFPIGGYRLRRAGNFIHQLLDSKADFVNSLPLLSDSYAALATALIDKVDHLQKLSHKDDFLPGYGADNTQLQIKILGPILEDYAPGKSGLRYLSSDSVTSNGHSIVLRLDYKNTRILLTGDLNERSQKLLLSYIPKEAYEVDVAKGCHHGAEDVLFDFLKAMKPKATVISSGDNESYSHPRPQIMGASAYYGSEYTGEDGKQYPPLVYSTELARSTKLSFPAYIKVRSDFGMDDYQRHYVHNALIQAKGTDEHYRKLKFVPINTDLIYGLVNIRTDGEKILIATREEQGKTFDWKVVGGLGIE